MARSAYDVQRDFALSSGFRSEIIWDSLTPDQSDILQQKIQTLLPDVEGKQSAAFERQRKSVFENVWCQRKYTNRILLSSIIYVLVTEEKLDITASPTVEATQITKFTCHPVFRTRKCMKAGESGGCCMVFIDETGRIYPNWVQYLKSNALPKGTMIAPARGVYTFNAENEVELELHRTAAGGVKSRVLNVSDKVANVGGLVATVPIVAALALPVAAPIALAATVMGVATATYSTVRSVSSLIDRSRHGQSTELSNCEARKSWLGVAGGVVGLGASGATKAMSIVANTGREVNMVTKLAVNGINVSSVVISGTGVANGVYDLYMRISDEQSVNGLDVLQLASSLMIFTHSINNLRLALKVTSGSGSTLRQAIRTKTRKLFRKISSQTLELHRTDGGGKFDIIRTFNDIPFKNTLDNLHTIHTQLTSGATAVAAIGSAFLPNIISVGAGGNMEINLILLAEQFGGQFVQHITSVSNFTNVLDSVGRYFCERTAQLLLQIARSFIEQSTERIERSLNTFVSTEMVLYRILMQCIKSYADYSYEYLNELKPKITSELEQYFDQFQPLNVDSRTRKCSFCKGTYYLCDL